MTNPVRERLPAERRSITKTLRIVGSEPLYVTVGFFGDGAPAEIFVFSRAGDQMSALCDAMAMAISLGLQHGIPMSSFTSKLIGFRCEPYGFTADEEFPIVASYLDYMARWLIRVTGPHAQATQNPV